MKSKVNILIMCTGNSARSQMAEGFLRKHGGDRFTVYSAGTDPTPLNPMAVHAMKEVGIDISLHRSKHFNEYLGKIAMYYLIVVCHDGDKNCPAIWPGCHERLYWPFEDPAAFEGSHEDKMEKFREVRGQIEGHILNWLAELPELGASISRKRKRAGHVKKSH